MGGANPSIAMKMLDFRLMRRMACRLHPRPSMVSDLRFAFRQFRKNPGFAAVAVLTLALGIGTCTAMFSIVHAVLLKPLPVAQPDRLVWIENVFSDSGLSGRTSRADTFLGWREQSQSFESLAAYFAFSDYVPLTMTETDGSERLRSVGVSENFLPTLGIVPLHGRNFNAEECTFNGPGAIILSHAYWKRRFGGDPSVVGRKVTLNQEPGTIIGVLPASFNFASIFTPGSEVDVINPFPLTPETARYGNTVFGIGRLKTGVSLAQAQADLTVVSDRLQETFKQGTFGARVTSLDAVLRGKFRRAFLLLAGAVVCVLAIACVNLSNLLLARLNSRRQEFNVRLALGASRLHLIRQTLMESLLLALAGSLIGVPVAIWAVSLLHQLASFGVPLLDEASVDFTVLGVTIGLTLLSGMACGLLPALQLFHTQGAYAGQDATHQRSAGRSAAKARSMLVVIEVALACLLLVGAGLLIRSFNAVLQVDLGFQPQHAMTWRIDRPKKFNSGEEVDLYLRGMASKITAIPGVEAVGFSDTLPLGRNRSWGAGEVGMQYPEGKYPSAYPRLVDPNYLKTMRIPLVTGRYFDETFNPSAEKTVIINENMAQLLWPGQDAIGRKITVGGGSTVIGVVANVRHSSLEETVGNEMYLDCRQLGDWSTLEMVVRSRRPSAELVPEVRTTLAQYDSTLPSGGFRTLDSLIDNAVGPRRFITRLLGFFSLLALILAAVGLYGVIAFSVGQRTHEIGIRMAVGAQRSDILTLVLRGGLRLVVIGIVAGLAGAMVLTGLLRSLLFGITSHDPLVFAGNAALLFAVASVACLIPAIRATRSDPMIVLRNE